MIKPYQNTATAKLIANRVRDLSHRKTQAEIASEAGFANGHSRDPFPSDVLNVFHAKYRCVL
jgi:hypothetical protein